MFDFHCPRCEVTASAGSSNCAICGYQFRVACPACSKHNPVAAKFCGHCGRGLEIRTRVTQKWENLLSFSNRRRLRNFGAGLAFGCCVTFFALSSLGMTYTPRNAENLPEKWACVEQSASLLPPTQSQERGPAQWLHLKACLAKENHRQATMNDLQAVGDLLLHLYAAQNGDEPITINNRRQALERLLPMTLLDGDDPQQQTLKRSTMTLFFFQFLRDILRFPVPNVKVSSCSDVPRFHMFHLPIETLRSFDLEPCRTADVFGDADQITVAALATLTDGVVELGEAHLSKQ